MYHSFSSDISLSIPVLDLGAEPLRFVSQIQSLCTESRQFLRLIHCLQKERGISVVFTFFGEAAFTENEDQEGYHGNCWWKNSLVLRKFLDSARTATDSVLSITFQSLQHAAGSDSTVVNGIMENLNDIRKRVDMFATAETQIHDRNVTLSSREKRLQELLLLFNHFITGMLDFLVIKRLTSFSKQLGCGDYNMCESLKQMEPIHSQSVSGINEVMSPLHDDKKTKSTLLLSLMQLLAILKESTGKERAALSGLLSLDETNCLVDYRLHESPILSTIINSLIFEDANQRMVCRQFRCISDWTEIDENTKSLMKLVEQSTSLPPEMERVQEKIRTSFALEGGLQHMMSLGQFWSLITLYLDRIHAVELLVAEEFESSLLCWISSSPLDLKLSSSEKQVCEDTSSLDVVYKLAETFGNSERKMLLQCLVDPKNSSNRVYARKLLQLPPEDIKSLLNEIMGHETISSNHRDINLNQKSREVAPSVVPFPRPTIERDEWHIDVHEVNFLKRIGSGAAGTTYLAQWSGQKVAVKVACITDSGLDAWQTEVQSLQQLHHPNVIRLLGSIYNTSPQAYGLVLEYCDSGDLSCALNTATPSNFFFRVASDVANGIHYLHNKLILHRDIKPANILISGDINGGNFVAKVSDFGLAVLHKSGEEHTAETGTYRYMSPEVIRHEKYSFQADIFSFALVLWQLVTHEEPFAGTSQIEVAGLVALQQARPPFPVGTPFPLMTLITTSWSDYPEDRRSFRDICLDLEKLEIELLPEQKVWLGTPHGHSVYTTKPRDDSFESQISLQNRTKLKRSISSLWNLVTRPTKKK